MDIIDLNERRSAKDRPDAEFLKKDDYGRDMYLYTLSYEFDGGRWSVEIWAYSMDDASDRVDEMRTTLKLDGQMMSFEPA